VASCSGSYSIEVVGLLVEWRRGCIKLWPT